MAWSIEPVASDVGRYDGSVTVCLDVADFEADVLADELVVAPGTDRSGSDELPAPVVHDTVSGEYRKERIDVVVVCCV